MSDLIDDYILHLPEESRIDYLILHDFIMNTSHSIVCEKKFNFPFYTSHGRLLLYIGSDKKTKQFYLGFCNGYLIEDEFNIFSIPDTKQIRKWYYQNPEQLEFQAEHLQDLILKSIQVNFKKSKK
jgi:hypothetical protein